MTLRRTIARPWGIVDDWPGWPGLGSPAVGRYRSRMAAESIRYQDVFVPRGFRHHTYNPRVELQLEQKVTEVNDNLCTLRPPRAL